MMRAAVCREYGPPDVITVEDVPEPEIGDEDLLIRVTSSTVNRTTSCIRSSTPTFGVRPMYGWRRPRREVLGTDFAGVVERVGSGVRGHEVGDRLFGFDDRYLGAHAELLALPAKAGISPIPDGISDDHAAASVEGAYYTLGYIERADLRTGQHALVYGGGGAIGSAAVQLLVSRGIEVVVVAEAHQLELMERLGAVRTIDYRVEDFTALDQRFDFVFDAVGKTTFGRCKGLLKDDGKYMATELGDRLENLRLSITTRFGGGPRVHFPLPGKVRPHLKTIGEELAAGTFRPVIDRTFELDDIADAYRYVDSERKTGNVILRISPPVVSSSHD